MYWKSVSKWILLLLLGGSLATFLTGCMQFKPDSDFNYLAPPIQKSTKPLLFHFHSQYCSICKRVTPVIRRLAYTKYQNKLIYIEVDVGNEENQGIAQQFGVHGIPASYMVGPASMNYRQIVPISYHGDPYQVDGAMKEALYEVTPL